MQAIRAFVTIADARVAFLSETLEGIKPVRCNGWSDIFFDKVLAIT
jgi:hypothetical protein